MGGAGNGTANSRAQHSFPLIFPGQLTCALGRFQVHGAATRHATHPQSPRPRRSDADAAPGRYSSAAPVLSAPRFTSVTVSITDSLYALILKKRD